MIDTNDGLITLNVSHVEDLQILICHSRIKVRPSIPKNLRWFIGKIDSTLKIPRTNKLSILNLGYSQLKTLSKSIIHASELEVLDMDGCGKLTCLPHSFGSLKKLQNLDLGGSAIQSLQESFGEVRTWKC